MRRSLPRAPPPRPSFVALALGLLALGALIGSAGAAPGLAGGGTAARLGAGARVVPSAGSAPATPALGLGATAAPSVICSVVAPTCPAAVNATRVELRASVTAPPTASWPNVQVAFVLETTSYDGDYGIDSAGLDPCAEGAPPLTPVCEESNGIPFFVAHAADIATAIQGANPHSSVSFALVDYYDAWTEPWDDQDGPEYHVDIGQFVPAGTFGNLVHSTFQQDVLGGGYDNWDQDMDNNLLDASQITAVYGALVGSDLDWAAGAHHVVVWIGSSAPRDPAYPENYCVSASAWNQWGAPGNCYSETCEPSYAFPTGPSPECEGWARSQDGNPNDSLAALAHHAPTCVDSVGGVCTIDTIDLWTTTTDPYSFGWPSRFASIGGGPGGAVVEANVARVIEAGCDLAAATGGTWDGPAFASCGDGATGTLQYVPHGPVDRPSTSNPSLFAALTAIGFGPVEQPSVAQGTDAPLFVFVPYGSIAVASAPEWTAACATPSGFEASCPGAPTVFRAHGVTAYGWNWSPTPAENRMTTGDVWTASFSVVATGPPYARVPVDACTTILCATGGSGAVGGLFTWANYRAGTNGSTVVQSFPLATVDVAPPAAPPGSSGLVPAAPPAPPSLPVPVPAGPVVPAPLPALVATGLPTVSLQAVAAGLLGAGFTRIGVKHRPIAVSVAASSGGLARPPGRLRVPPASRFE